LLTNYNPEFKKPLKLNYTHLGAALKPVFIIGMLNKGRRQYWKLLIWSLFRRPAPVSDAIPFSIYA